MDTSRVGSCLISRLLAVAVTEGRVPYEEEELALDHHPPPPLLLIISSSLRSP